MTHTARWLVTISDMRTIIGTCSSVLYLFANLGLILDYLGHARTWRSILGIPVRHHAAEANGKTVWQATCLPGKRWTKMSKYNQACAYCKSSGW